MVKTHGLTHLSLSVRDPDHSLAFYAKVFGVKEYYRDATSIQVQGPGKYDVIAFEKDAKERGEFSPGFPYAYAADPDGYIIEIWFE